MEIKIGERVIMKSGFIKEITSKEKEISSRTFVITAITDIAVGIKNLRTSKSYTVRIEDVVNNIEEFEPVKENRTTGAQNTVVIDIPTPKIIRPAPPILEPESKPKLQKATYICNNEIATIKISSKDIKAEVIKGDDPFRYLYESQKQ
jgi:hypothetical protein